MGYHSKDIEEYEDDELVRELERRRRCRERGVCDYCEKPPTAPTCRLYSHHAKAGLMAEYQKLLQRLNN